jgi:undecaprenyl-diphosphatase
MQRERMRRRRHFLLLIGVVLPLAVFASLAFGLHAAARFSYDDPALLWTHAWAGPGMDRFFLWTSHLGFAYGVLPFDILFVLALLLARRWREGVYAFAALGGSIWLNGALKGAFARPRPDLWEPMLHYPGYSFPSGHAMATMTLAWVLGLLAWRTRWRWPVLALMSAFTALVGLSRLYMGVHFPSDVLAGWAAGAACAVACFFAVFGRHRHPWERTTMVEASPTREAR